MPAIISTTRAAWYRLIAIIIGLHALFYLLAIIAIAKEMQWLCILFSVVYSVIVLVIGFAPDTLGALLVGSVLWGILPTTGSVANAITIIVKDFVRGVVYLAMVNSFMLFFLGTWNFGRYPGSAAVIIAAALMLGYWGMIYKGDEWFKKIVLWYGVGAIVISLLVSFIPGIVPGKSERELSRTEQLLDENRDKQLTKKQRGLQERIQKEGITRDQLSDADKKILEEARDFSRTGQAVSLAEEIWISATKPGNRIWWYAIGLVLLLAIIFRVLKNSKVAAWIVAIVAIVGFSLFVYIIRDSAKEAGRDFVGTLEREITVETTLMDFQEKTLSAPVPKAGYYRVSIYASPEYSYVCPGAGGVTPGYTTDGDGFGNIQVQGSKNGSPVGNGETILIDEEKITLGFRFPAIQWNAIQDCKAIIIGGLKLKLYLKEI